MARENPGWGYDRIVGALTNLGHPLSNQTVKNVLASTWHRSRSKKKPSHNLEGFHRHAHERAGWVRFLHC